MGEAGVDRFHIAHVLNHRSVTHSTVTAIYDRYRYDKEKRAALENGLRCCRDRRSQTGADYSASEAHPTSERTTSSRGPSDVPAIRHERRRTYAVCVASRACVSRLRGRRGSPQGDPEELW